VVLLNFNSASQRLSNYVLDELMTVLVRNGKLTVVDRANLEDVRREMDFQMSGEVSDESAQSIGRILGAQYIISGSLEELGANYVVRFRAIAVETAALQALPRFNVRKDTQIADLMEGGNTYSQYPSYATTQKWAIGGQAGTFYGVASSEDFDAMGIGDFGFFGGLYGAYAFNSLIRLQLGVNIAMNNVNTSSDPDAGAEWNYKYTSLDIPLLLNFYFRPSANIMLRISAGPYMSMRFTDLEHNDAYDQYEIKEEKVLYGFTAGFGGGYRIDKGNIVLDLRILSDLKGNVFQERYYSYELFRRGITATVGYEYWF
jgi:TolB-like protein